MKKLAFRQAIRFIMFSMWIVGMYFVYNVQMGKISHEYMFPGALIAVFGMSYFLVNIYRLQTQHTDKMALIEFDALLEPITDSKN